MDLAQAVAQWQGLLGHACVLSQTQAQGSYGCDTSAASRHIAAALRIENRDHLPDVMRIAHGCQVPVYPISTGNNWGYGTALPARNGSVIVDLSRLQRIIHFDAELGVVTLEPGVTQGMLAQFLDAGNHPYLVPVTGAGPNCSLLGNALERGYGITPHADHFSAVTDLEAVLPDGSLYRTALREAGGEELARLFKWGIGPYSAGLFTQSGFGIVTRVSIILARRPECVKACFFGLSDDALLEPAVAAVRTLLVKLPGILGAVNLMNRHRVLAMTTAYPAHQVGPDGVIPEAVIARMGEKHQVMPWTGLATLYGTPGVVAVAQKEIRRALSGISSRMLFLTPQNTQTIYRVAQWVPGSLGTRMMAIAQTLVRSLELVAGRPNETALPLAYWRSPQAQMGMPSDPSRDGCGLIWYAPLVPMRGNDVRGYVDLVSRLTQRHALEPLITLTSVSDKLFDSTVPLLFARGDAAAVASAHACYSALLHSGRSRGWFPYRVGVDTMGPLMSLQSDSSVFHERLRKDIDPYNLMAPGRYR